MTKKTYNGWTNYETWLVKLWMDNEEGSYNYWTERAQEIYNDSDEDHADTRAENAVRSLREELKDQHEETISQSGVPDNGFIADLVNAAMSEVNWHEIATSLVDEVDKIVAPDEEEAVPET